MDPSVCAWTQTMRPIGWYRGVPDFSTGVPVSDSGETATFIWSWRCFVRRSKRLAAMISSLQRQQRQVRVGERRGE